MKRQSTAALSALALVAAAALTAAAPTAAAPAERRADRPPVATDDAFVIAEDTRLLVRAPGIRANDRDPERRRLTVTLVKKPQHGKVRLSEKGRLRYVPDRDWNGKDELVYKVTDPGGNSDRATVSFKVTPVNDAPSMTLKATTPVREGGATRLTVVADDPEKQRLRYSFDCDGDGDFEVGPQADNVHECAYGDDGAQRPGARVTDSKGGASQLAINVSVVNVRPNLTTTDQTAPGGAVTPIDLGSFTDPGDDGPWSVTVDWGDGSDDTQFVVNATGDLGSRNHTFPSGADTYDVTITVAEAGGTVTGTETFQVDVTG